MYMNVFEMLVWEKALPLQFDPIIDHLHRSYFYFFANQPHNTLSTQQIVEALSCLKQWKTRLIGFSKLSSMQVKQTRQCSTH